MALDWDKLRVFHTVAVAGSFTRATHILNISQSAISRQVSILEDELGMSLFERLARGLRLTEAGHKLNVVVTNVFAKLAMVETAITEEKNLPKGKLTLIAPTSVGALLVAPHLKGFLQAYPDMRIHIRLASEALLCPTGDVDMAVVTMPFENAEYITSEPIDFRARIYTSQKYIEKHGRPQTLEELDDHNLIVSSQGSLGNLENHWLLNLGSKIPRDPFMIVESSMGIAEAVKSGLGIGCLYEYLVEEGDDLVELDFDSTQHIQQRYIVYPKHLGDLKRIQLFAQFLTDIMKKAGA